MAGQRHTATFGAALVLALSMVAAAPAQDWVNPDGSRVGESELDEPADGAPGNETGPVTRREKGVEPPGGPRLEIRPLNPLESDAGVPRAAEFPIPRGHLPPPGACRVWFPDRPPGHQPPPGPCERLRRHVPYGAILVRG